MRLAFLIAACVVSAYATGPTKEPQHTTKSATPQHPAKSVPTTAAPQHPKKAPLLDGGGKIISDEYIVVFKEDTSEETG